MDFFNFLSLDLKVRQAALYIAAIVVYNLPNFKNQYTVYMEKESTQQKDHNSISMISRGISCSLQYTGIVPKNFHTATKTELKVVNKTG